MLLFLGISFSQKAYCLPDSFEIWFVSSSELNTTYLLPELERKVLFSKSYAQAYKCIPMGEYCFDPQVGLYKKDGSGTGDFKAAPDIDEIQNDKNAIPTASSLDRNLINCEKEENMFDIYCGKASGNDSSSSSRFQIWIDTSSSMRKIDETDKAGSCAREMFVQALRSKCPLNKDLSFEVFNTRKKQLGAVSDVCLNVGLNDPKRLIKWIQSSNAKKLIVITDIFELNSSLTNFVIQNGGTLRGHENGDTLSAQSIVALAPKFANTCKKK